MAAELKSEDEMSLDELLKDIESNPAKLATMDISESLITRLNRALQKFPKLSGVDESTDDYDKILACCFYNVREEYCKKYAVTGVVSFIYQILKEWEGDPKASRWSDITKKSADPLNFDSIIENLETTLTLAKAAKTKLDDTKERKRELLIKQVADEPINNLKEDETSIENDLNDAYTNIFRTYHSIINTSSEIKLRLDASYKVAEQDIDVKTIIKKEQFKDPVSQYNVPVPVCKNIINQFLLEHFKYDPTKHLKKEVTVEDIEKDFGIVPGTESLKHDTKDPDRTVLQSVTIQPEHKELFDCITRDKETEELFRGIICDNSNCQYIKEILPMRDIFMQYLQPKTIIKITPPMDTFHSLNFFMNVNNQEIKNVVSALYNEKIDIGSCVALWKTFEGVPADVDREFQKFKMRNQLDFPFHTVHSLRFGGWTPLADMKENRAKIDYLKENTEVLERILKRADEDKNAADKLLRQRTYMAKAKNIEEDGVDASALKNYSREQTQNKNTAQGSGVNKTISAKEMRHLELAKGNTKRAQELELLEQYETDIEELTEKQATSTLTAEEEERLRYAKANIDVTREMAAVPEGQVQVDFYVNKGGEMEKRILYVPADDA